VAEPRDAAVLAPKLAATGEGAAAPLLLACEVI
jgi:hypothetical protein